MKRLAAVTLFLFTTTAFAQQSADMVNAIKTLDQMQLIANAFEIQKSMKRPLQVRADLADSWGTPLRISTEGTTYRIVSAGADRKFDEKSWTETTQFTGVDGDLVLTNGRMSRSNRNWLAEHATDEASLAALKTLSRHELTFMVSRTPMVTTVSMATATVETMQNVATYIDRYRDAAAAPPSDAWGTPMRLVFQGTDYRLVSAGSDLEFQQETWDQAGVTTKPEDDIVMKNGTFMRKFDARAFYEAAREPIPVVPQPPDPSYATATGTSWARVGGDVKAPVVIERVQPTYPNDYRMARVSGLVIVEVAVTATGAIENVAILKSLGPEMDLSARRAVRQWKFQPATRNGEPVPALVNVTINFQLSNDKAAPAAVQPPASKPPANTP